MFGSLLHRVTMRGKLSPYPESHWSTKIHKIDEHSVQLWTNPPHTNKQAITKSPNSPVFFCDLASVGFEEIPFTTLHTSIATWTTEDHPTKHFTEFMRSCIGLWCPTSTQLVQHPMLGRLDVLDMFLQHWKVDHVHNDFTYFTISRCKRKHDQGANVAWWGKETTSALLEVAWEFS